MKLFYAPSACSLAPHIVISEANLDVELVKVEFGANGRTAGGQDYYSITPRGAVPALQFDSGEVMTENQVILQYLSSLAPEADLGPPAGGIERWRFLELLNFIATELHKGFGPLFNPKTPPEYREVTIQTLGKRFDLLEPVVARQPWAAGEAFSIADAYLFTILNWTNVHKIDITPWPNLKAYMARVAERPGVHKALQEEGLA
jgi:glutathione S-transferase